VSRQSLRILMCCEGLFPDNWSLISDIVRHS
jgi:hypothetical protein